MAVVNHLFLFSSSLLLIVLSKSFLSELYLELLIALNLAEDVLILFESHKVESVDQTFEDVQVQDFVPSILKVQQKIFEIFLEQLYKRYEYWRSLFIDVRELSGIVCLPVLSSKQISGYFRLRASNS